MQTFCGVSLQYNSHCGFQQDVDAPALGGQSHLKLSQQYSVKIQYSLLIILREFVIFLITTQSQKKI